MPKLRWSDRRIDQFQAKTSLTKAIVVGKCLYKDTVMPFLLKLDLETKVPELIKVMQVQSEVTALSFGPYDNNYLLVGLSTGYLLVYDVIEMERIATLNLFDNEPITRLTYEPANLIFAGSLSG